MALELPDDNHDEADPLADELIAAFLRGDSAAIAEITEQNPRLAEKVRSLIPTVALLERQSSLPSDEIAAGRSDLEVRETIAPRSLGEFLLLREIGRGGMGVVFEAWQESLQRYVAVKVLTGSSLFDERSRERFLREARIVASLKHDHIVPIYSVGQQEDVLFYAMELIQGTSLDQLVSAAEARTVPDSSRARWVARLGIQAAEALGCAHAAGILHRDVKPSNFVLDPEGKLWLADFGLAKLIDQEHTPLTTHGRWLGTRRYMAPEALRGMPIATSDVYSLGLTLYELLVGEPAFSDSALDDSNHGSLPPPRRRWPSIPIALETILLKASDPEPDHRYQSAESLAADLERFLAGQPIQARRRYEFLRRRPVRAILFISALFLVALLTYLTWGQFGRATRPLENATHTAVPSPSVPELKVDSRPPPPSPPKGRGWGFGFSRRRGHDGSGASTGRGRRQGPTED